MTRATHDEYQHWLPLARAVEKTDNPLNVPFDVALREANDAAAFIDSHWEPNDGIPGLKSVHQRLPHATADEIRALVAATSTAQTHLLLITDPAVVEHGPRARTVLDELESAIEFTLDDDVHEPADDQLSQLRRAHADDGQAASALAQALRDYAALAHTLEARIREADAEFDPALIAEARRLATHLSAQPTHAAPHTSNEATAATRIRNQFLQLLTARVNLVRRTARHVYRNHAPIARQATSGYERRRRAAHRRATATPPASPPPSATT